MKGASGEGQKRKEGEISPSVVQAAKKFRAYPALKTLDETQFEQWKKTPLHGKKVRGTSLVISKTPIGSEHNAAVGNSFVYDVDAMAEKLLSQGVNIGLVIFITDDEADPLFFDERTLDDWDIELVRVRVTLPRNVETADPIDALRRSVEETEKAIEQLMAEQPKRGICIASRFGRRRPQLIIAGYLRRQAKSLSEIADALKEACPTPLTTAEMEAAGIEQLQARKQSSLQASIVRPKQGLDQSGAIESVDYVEARLEEIFGIDQVKNLFCSAAPLTSELVGAISQQDTLMSWIPQRERSLLYINGTTVYTIDTSGKATPVKMTFPKFVDLQIKSYLTYTVLDGYVVEDKDRGNKITRYLVEDLLCLDGKSVTHEPLSKRLGLLQKNVLEPRKDAERKRAFDASKDTFRIRLKENMKAKHFKYFKEKFVTQLTHDVSGIIFQDPKAFYAFGHTTSKTTWSLTAANQVDESSLASHLGGDRA